MNTVSDHPADAPVLDIANQRIERAGERIQLTPKAFAVLMYLHRGAGQLVTKEALLEAVWPRVYVGEAVLKVTVREIRKALADDARAPRYLETVHRRGYRLIATLPGFEDQAPGAAPSLSSPAVSADHATPRAIQEAIEQAQPASSDPRFAGRQSALDLLAGALRTSLTGQRQLVFVTGEAGIGKTALIDAWLAMTLDIPGAARPLRACGVCMPHAGTVEPYLAVLDALGRLVRQHEASWLLPLLWRYAPGWLMQMPWLVDEAGRARLQRELFGSTRERMLRELAELIEALTLDAPLILILEDLHWSDHATLDLVGYLARRAEPCRCCLIATFRPDELVDGEHPLQRLHRELQGRGRCETLHLDGLDAAALHQIVTERLLTEGRSVPHDLPELLHRYSGGNPLFLHSLLDELLESGELVCENDRWILKRPLNLKDLEPPQRIRDVLDRQAERLTPAERELLGAASLPRGWVQVSALAALLESDPLDLEDVCEALARTQRWLRQAPSEGAGAEPGTYALAHTVYRHYWREQVPAGRARKLHRRLAQHLADSATDHDGHPHAAEIAWHFSAAGEREAALDYWQRAATIAAGRFAPREAAACLDEGLELLARLDAPGSARHLGLLSWRNALLIAAGDLECAIPAYQAQAALAMTAGNLAELARARLGLATTLFWVDRAGCLNLAAQALSAAQAQGDPLLVAQVRGWQAHWECIIQGYSDERAAAYETAVAAARAAADPRLDCQHTALQSYVRISRGDYLGGCAAAAQGLRLAEQTGDAHNHLVCHFFQAWGLFYLGRWGEMRRTVEAGSSMAVKNGHLPWQRHFDLQLAWLHVHAGDPPGARALCEPVFTTAQYAGLRNSEWFLSLILLAEVALAEQDVAGAEQSLGIIAAHLDAQPDAIDSVLRLPLQLVRIVCLQRRAAWREARAAAETLLALAAVPRERTYCALAHTRLAEIALAEGDLAGAARALGEAFASIESGDAPVAAWQTHAAQADLCALHGDLDTAGCHRRASAWVLARLGRSLDPVDPLRASLRALARDQSGIRASRC